MQLNPDKKALRKELFSRFLLIPWINWSVLRKLVILVVGIGNNGSPIAYMLYGLGIAGLYLIDNDCVSVSNLPRQMLFSFPQLYMPKVSAASEALKAKFGDCIKTELALFPKRIQDAKIPWSKINLVFCCVDNHDARKFILEKCLANKIPLVDMGIEANEGQFGYVLYIDKKKYPDGACIDCFVDFSRKTKPKNNDGCRVASATPYTGMYLASAAMGMFTHHAMNHVKKKANFFRADFNSMESSFSFLKSRASCDSCGVKK